MYKFTLLKYLSNVTIIHFFIHNDPLIYDKSIHIFFLYIDRNFVHPAKTFSIIHAITNDINHIRDLVTVIWAQSGQRPNNYYWRILTLIRYLKTFKRNNRLAKQKVDKTIVRIPFFAINDFSIPNVSKW